MIAAADFVVRFFDCEDSRDLADLKLITESPEALRWMDDTNDLSLKHYQNWMDCKGQGNKFLFAIAGDERVHGFVYIYLSEILEDYLEISYARRPDAPHGLIVPAIEQVLKRPEMAGMKILAEIERGNEPSIKVIERAGFTKIRDFDTENNALWARDMETKKPFEHLGRIRQLNNSFCGPATLQILLSHFGLIADQNKLVEAATTREHALRKGMSIELLALAVKNLFPAYRLWAKREASVADLEKMVRECNYPVGIDWQGIFEDDEYPDDHETIYTTLPGEDDSECKGETGHYSVIIDADSSKNYVRMLNPYGHFSEKDQFIDLNDFLKRWWDDRMDYFPDGSKKYVFEKKLMFVVVPMGVTIPESLGMVEI